MQFISTSTTSWDAWTTLEKTYASPSRGRNMIHRQNLVSPQQGNQTITTYMQDVKHNIGSLALMNVLVNFDELSIHVLNGLGPAYSNISHAYKFKKIMLRLRNCLSTYLLEGPTTTFGFFSITRHYSSHCLGYLGWPFLPSSIAQPWRQEQ